MKPSRQRAFHLPGFLALALCALTCSPALLADLNTGLVAWYPFDGNASDMSGNGNHGTVNGATLGADRHGVASKAYSFDGVDDYISTASQTWGFSNTYSVSLWYYSNPQDDGTLFSLGQTGFLNEVLIGRHWANELGFYNHKSGSNWPRRYYSESYNVWNHVVGVSNGGFTIDKFFAYLNGQAVQGYSTLGTPGMLADTSPRVLHIGQRLNNSTFYNGSIDDVRIYDRALSANEVAQLYAMESALPAGFVTLDKLSPGLSDLLDGNGTIEQALPAGSVIAVKPGDPAPAGYTLFQRNEYNASLTWEEMAPVSVARKAYDGVEALDGKIYFVGGATSSTHNIAERYDPFTNQWETLATPSSAGWGVSTTVLNGKLYAIGGLGLSSVEIYDPGTSQWSSGPALPSVVYSGNAITVDGKILLVGGRNSSGTDINQVLELDPSTNQWTQKAPMSTARRGVGLVLLEDNVWSIGGEEGGAPTNKVEIYHVANDSWTTGPSLTTPRKWASAWVANGRIYAMGGRAGGSTYLNSIEVYDPAVNQWTATGTLPQNMYCLDAAVLSDKVYVVAGTTAAGIYSKKVFAATLPPPARDLYFRDGNATAEAATEPALDGNLTITLNMLAPDALAKLNVSQTHAQSAGSVIAVPKDSAPPTGYSLYKRSDRNSTLVWEEKAPVSVARFAYDGVEAMDGKIYFAGGADGTQTYNLVERYDPYTDQWETLTPMSTSRSAPQLAVLNDKLYVIGGGGLSSVEIFDPQTAQWTAGAALPNIVGGGAATTCNGKIFIIGGNDGSQNLNQVLEFDPITNQWSQKASMPTARHGLKLAVLGKRIFAIGGIDSSKVEIYDVANDSWNTASSLNTARVWPSVWVANGNIFASGGSTGGNTLLDSIEVYDPNVNLWKPDGFLPEKKYCADASVLAGNVFIIGGERANNDFSAKVFAADVTPPMDLYFRDANATGTITLDKFAGAVVSKLDGNASALPPIGAVSAIDHNDVPPADHAVLERTERNATHVWEEMAPVQTGRDAHGIISLEGYLYMLGGSVSGTFPSSVLSSVERYDPVVKQWTSVGAMPTPRDGLSTATAGGKIYVFGGQNASSPPYLSSVEVYDPATDSWTAKASAPHELLYSCAVTVGDKILLIGGQMTNGTQLNKVLEFDPVADTWTEKAAMPHALRFVKAITFQGKVYAIGGEDPSQVNYFQEYDPQANTWTQRPNLLLARAGAMAFSDGGKLYVVGGRNGAGGGWGTELSSVEVYDPVTQTWSSAGNLPDHRYVGGAAILKDKVFLVGGRNNSEKPTTVYAADLIPHRDLYFREVNATAPAESAPNQAPVFSGGTATFTTPENNATATFVVTATDPDANTTLVYSASGPDAAKFTLNAITGELTFNAAPDYEANASASGNNAYVVTITVSDGEQTATQNVTVNVTDDPADNPIDLTSGLVAWYPFDGNASDMSGNGNHGTVYGAILGTDRHGRTGKAYSFDGVDDYIRIANSPSLNPSALSIALWFKGTESFAGAGSNVLIHKPYTSHVSPFYQWHLHIGGDEYHTHLGKFQFGIWANGSGLGTGNLNTTEILNHWRFMTGVVDPVSQTASFFLDGVKTLTSPSPWNGIEIPSYETDVFIAKHGNLNSEIHYTPGYIDEIRIYDRALSAAEVATLYQLESTPPTDNNGTNPPVDGNASDPDPDPPPTLFRPLPKTLAREELGNSNFRLWGQVLADGGSPVTGVAFELADNMVFRNSTLHPASMLAGSPSFFGEFTLEPGKRYYYRAVATNAMGTTSGSPKRLITPPSQARWWTNAPEISGGWRNSPWLGAFRPYDNGWIYHAKLGWAYAHPDGSGGLWLWFRDHHWTWTRSGTYPYLWKHDLGSWHYLLGTRNGQPVFYDFSSNSVR